MSTEPVPNGTKTVRVSHEMHTQLGALADRLNGTVDDAVRYLLDRDMVRIPMAPEQRRRWQDAATGTGMKLEEFVTARVEAAIQYGSDRGTIELMYRHIRELRNEVRARMGDGA
jgi:hypothetical protein